MTIKNRFRKTMKKGISKYKRYRKDRTKTTKKGGVSSISDISNTSASKSKLSEDLYGLMVQLDRDIEGPEQKESILNSIDEYIKNNNIVIAPPVPAKKSYMDSIGSGINMFTSLLNPTTSTPKSAPLMASPAKKSLSDSIDSGIELIGSWLLPVKSKNGRKNIQEIAVYFYPSLIKSKKDPNNPNKPNLRFGNIMIKYNNTYADISSYFSTMTRQTDDFLAAIRRGEKAKVVYPRFFHKEKLISTELLDDNWKLETTNDCNNSDVHLTQKK
jgi:hypothetical protein